jgi:hypothetical protein
MAANVLRNFLPSLEAAGIATEEEVGIADFEERLRAAVVAQRGVLMQPLTIGAWAQKP